MELIDVHKAEVQPLMLQELTAKNLTADILRLDKIHPVVSGNKWFKLKYYLEDAVNKRFNTIITFGGAWSNHIIAAAYLARIYGLHSIGIIRGEKPLALSQTLLAAIDNKMILEFITRQSYSAKEDSVFKAALQEKFGRAYMIPEGGAGIAGVRGSEDILSLTDLNKYSHILCCVGTGTMYTGLINASLPHQEIIGIPVLKGMVYDPESFNVNTLRGHKHTIIDSYHFGGYAKKKPELINFMNHFYKETGIATDFVYTGKLLYAFADLVSNEYFNPGSAILVIHSGGLQGNASLPIGTLQF